MPAQIVYPAGIQQFLRRSVGLVGIIDCLSGKSHDVTYDFCDLTDSDIRAGADIQKGGGLGRGLRDGPGLHQKDTGGGHIVDMEKLPAGGAGSPEHDPGGAGTGGGGQPHGLSDIGGDGPEDGLVPLNAVEIALGGQPGQMIFPDQGRNHMAVLQMIGVAGSIEVGGHDRRVMRTILVVIGLAHLDPGYLGDGVGFIGRLQDPGEQILFPHGLGGEFWIDTGTAEKEEMLDAGAEGLMDHSGLHHQILIDEVGRIGVVGMNAAHLGRRQDHVVDVLIAEKRPHRPLVQQVKLGMGPGDDPVVTEPLQTPDDGRADHAPVTGNKDGGAGTDRLRHGTHSL